MISIKEFNSKVRLPVADYVFEDVATLEKVLPNLTPRIEGVWNMLLVDPSIKECKAFLCKDSLPEWVTLTIYLPPKKISNVCLDYPQYQPKTITFREQADIVLSSIKHVVDQKAYKLLLDAFRGNIVDFQATLDLLDKECTSPTITVAEVQKRVNYQKPTYASEVINAFLLGDKNRWKLLDKLLVQLGEEYAYNAMYKYVKSLLKSKNDYLNNIDSKNYVVQRIAAPAICNAYVAFTLSNNYKQLYNVLHVIEDRNRTVLDSMSEYYLD